MRIFCSGKARGRVLRCNSGEVRLVGCCSTDVTVITTPLLYRDCPGFAPSSRLHPPARSLLLLHILLPSSSFSNRDHLITHSLEIFTSHFQILHNLPLCLKFSNSHPHDTSQSGSIRALASHSPRTWTASTPDRLPFPVSGPSIHDSRKQKQKKQENPPKKQKHGLVELTPSKGEKHTDPAHRHLTGVCRIFRAKVDI